MKFELIMGEQLKLGAALTVINGPKMAQRLIFNWNKRLFLKKLVFSKVNQQNSEIKYL